MVPYLWISVISVNMGPCLINRESICWLCRFLIAISYLKREHSEHCLTLELNILSLEMEVSTRVSVFHHDSRWLEWIMIVLILFWIICCSINSEWWINNRPFPSHIHWWQSGVPADLWLEEWGQTEPWKIKMGRFTNENLTISRARDGQAQHQPQWQGKLRISWLSYVELQAGQYISYPEITITSITKCDIEMGVSWNRGTPKSSNFNRIFPCKPSILGVPPFQETPIYHHFTSVLPVIYHHFAGILPIPVSKAASRNPAAPPKPAHSLPRWHNQPGCRGPATNFWWNEITNTMS